MLLVGVALGIAAAVAIHRHLAETYRCPHCAKIEMGKYHRFHCPEARKEEPSSPSETLRLRAPTILQP